MNFYLFLSEDKVMESPYPVLMIFLEVSKLNGIVWIIIGYVCMQFDSC